MLRFHSPLVEPDGRIYRIRLSDKAVHAFAHENGVGRGSAGSHTSPSFARR
jgi:hypothetical protein